MTMLITGETWGENVDGVRAYLLNEAERSLDELRPKLVAAQREFSLALADVSDAQAQFAPASGEGEDAWGIAEVVRHIASIEPIMARRVRLLGNGEPLESLQRTTPGYLDDVQTREIAKLREMVEMAHNDLLGAIDEINGHERVDTVAEHRRFGELNCHGWVVLQTIHLQDHAQQIARLKDLAGYPLPAA
jgi:DinB family protein